MDDFKVPTNFSLSSLFENSYTTYGLIAITLITIAYFVYKYYLNKNNYIGSTDIDSLQNYEQQTENYEQQPENYGEQQEELR